MTPYHTQFINYCKSFGAVSDGLQEAIIHYGKVQVLQKGDHYLREGSFAEKQGFVVEGILRHYYTDEVT